MKKYIAAIDQGTTSSRCIIFNHAGVPVGSGQLEHEQIYPQAGWVEHDPMEIWTNVQTAVSQAIADAGITSASESIAAIGITNQRETAVVWNRRTGKPMYNAIVWQDTRTDDLCKTFGGDVGATRYQQQTGLPLATYFSAPKVRWILDNVPGVYDAAMRGDAMFGTIDSWLIWNLSGGAKGGVHVTDVTNASRTMLMELETLAWSPTIAGEMGIPMNMLPDIRPSSQIYGYTTADTPFGSGIPIAGDLGDQQAAMAGQSCFDVGDVKNTYGTGCFMLLNTGNEIVHSQHGLLTTVCYQLEGETAVYALEGSIAITGALVQWLRDNLNLIENAADIEACAQQVEDNGDVYFVPAFSGLFAPYWRDDARGAIVGLTRFANKGHICRAALEATAFQTRELLDAMQADVDVQINSIKVDGGMVHNELLMQFQADVLNVPTIRPKVAETTALGAAYAAGLAVEFWADKDSLRQQWAMDKTWKPSPDNHARTTLYARWKKAVTKTFDWK